MLERQREHGGESPLRDPREVLAEITLYLHQTTPWGQVFSEGESTGVTIHYLERGVMEVRGLPPGLPPNVRFDDKGILGSGNGEEWEGVNSQDLNIFRLLDPRLLRRGLQHVEWEKPREVIGAKYFIDKLDLDLPEELIAYLYERKSSLERTVRFSIEGERLKEMIQADLPPILADLTVRFSSTWELRR